VTAQRRTTAAVLAVDGGNSKTDVLVVGHDGTVLGSSRGPTSTPHLLGAEGSVALLDELVSAATARVQADGPVTVPLAEVAAVYLAGADYPQEVAELEALVRPLGWAREAYVENDTLALLRAGTDAPDAVAVVCGAGINAVGVAADGRQLRFPALGQTSGDWGGGEDLGKEALWAAARDEDGRGPATSLTAAVLEHYGLATVADVSAGLHFERLAEASLIELAPAVISAARAGDPVAAALMDRQAGEVAVMAVAALRRLGLLDGAASVVLGGSVLVRGGDELVADVTARIHASAPLADVSVVAVPPVVGAALAGLDRVGAPAAAHENLRREAVRGLPR
jgi:N-acetylglucosamine kinase-like BadF-type ATPase